MIQQALNGMITLMLAKFVLNDVPHAMLDDEYYRSRGYRIVRAFPQGPRTLVILPETKLAMLSLCKRAQGKLVEFALQLDVRGDSVVSGVIKWGRLEFVHVSRDKFGGLFHTHPDRFIEGTRVVEREREPELSWYDKLTTIVERDRTAFSGVGTPHRTYARFACRLKRPQAHTVGRLREFQGDLSLFGQRQIEAADRESDTLFVREAAELRDFCLPIMQECIEEHTIQLDDGSPSYIGVLE